MHSSQETLQKLSGIYDNRNKAQREVWKDDELVGQWPSGCCGDMTQSLLPEEREILEKPWGSYPPRE